MTLLEAKELLELLENYPQTDIRISLDNLDVAQQLKAANFHVVLEANVWRSAELTIPFKSL